MLRIGIGLRLRARAGSGSADPLVTAEAQVLALGPDCWFEGDHASIDGMSGKTRALIDKTDALHELAQPTPALQPAAPASQAFFGGRPVVYFAGTQRLVTTRAAAAFSYLADGTGCSRFVVLRRVTIGNGIVMATQSGDARTTGYDNNVVGQDPTGISYQSIGAAATALTPPAARGVDTVHTFTFVGADARFYVDDALAARSTAPVLNANPPIVSASPAPLPLTVGTDAAGNYGATMYLACVLMFTRVLSASERYTCLNYFALKYATPAPTPP